MPLRSYVNGSQHMVVCYQQSALNIGYVCDSRRPIAAMFDQKLAPHSDYVGGNRRPIVAVYDEHSAPHSGWQR